MTKILISCMNGIISYELIKYLKSKKNYIIGIDIEKNGLGKKICNEFYISPKGNSKAFIKFIDNLAKKVDIIFFYADEEIYNISKNINKLKCRKKIVLSEFRTVNLCNDKNKLKKYLYNKNILLPAHNINNKSIIKKNIGRGSKFILITKLKNEINFFKKNKEYLVENYIYGKEYTVDCLFDKNNNLTYSVARERIVSSNVSIINRILRGEKFKKIIKNISQYINFYGPINFQFIECEKSKKIFLIEINPRLSGGVIFSIQSGFDVITLAIDIHLNKKIDYNQKFKYNQIHMRYLKTYK